MITQNDLTQAEEIGAISFEMSGKVSALITEIQRLQILIAWEAGELTEGKASAMLKQYGGLTYGRLEARELKEKAIEAGKALPFPRPLRIE